MAGESPQPLAHSRAGAAFVSAPGSPRRSLFWNVYLSSRAPASPTAHDARPDFASNKPQGSSPAVRQLPRW